MNNMGNKNRINKTSSKNRMGIKETMKETIKETMKETVKHYLQITKEALDKARKAISNNNAISNSNSGKKQAAIVLDMAERYYKDAIYWQKKKQLVTALAAVSYAHGWIDCGSKLGLFNVKDSRLFIIKCL